MLNKFKLNDKVELDNKVVMAPMTNYLSNDDLTVSDQEVDYYAARSKEVGMVITACTFFQPNGQGFANQFYAGDDSYIPSLKKLAHGIKKEGSKAVLQMFHGGRMADPSKGDLVSASAVKPTHSLFGPIEDIEKPRKLSNEEVWEIVDGFYETTRRAIEAGFDGVEIHGANTYLIQQFFSPHSNRRDDEWGGSREDRIKFPLEVIKAVNKAKKEYGSDEFIVGYRFSPEELEKPGITLDDTLYLVDQLAEQDIDYLHVSLNDYRATSMRDEEDDRLIGELLLNKINGRKPLIGVGSIATKEDAEDALNNIGYDLIALGHSMITDPNWVTKIKNDRKVETAIDMDNLEEQKLPRRLAEKIKEVPGWFDFK